VYNFAGAWVAHKHKEIFGDIQGDPTDHPELLNQLKQAVDNDLKIDYLVTGSCMITTFYPSYILLEPWNRF
jgi:phosphoserine aminotransferase